MMITLLLSHAGQGSDPKCVRPHLKNIFDNIADIEFEQSNDIRAAKHSKIISMRSSEGETVNLKDVVTAEGNIETWLTHLLDAMRKTVKVAVYEAVVTHVFS